MPSRPRFLAAPAWLVPSALLLGTGGCTALATSPEWTGGGLAVSSPVREAELEAEAAAERERIAREPLEIGARHILVMHAESLRKPEEITRPRPRALELAKQCLQKIRGGQKFDAVAAECSDDAETAQSGGDLGVFRRDKYVKPLSDVAFSLEVGEVSDIIETPFGFHIVQRTE